MKNYICFGQLSLFDSSFSSDLNSIDFKIDWFDSSFSVGTVFLYGKTLTPIKVIDMCYGSKFFKYLFLDPDLNFTHYCYKKAFGKVYFLP